MYEKNNGLVMKAPLSLIYNLVQFSTYQAGILKVAITIFELKSLGFKVLKQRFIIFFKLQTFLNYIDNRH